MEKDAVLQHLQKSAYAHQSPNPGWSTLPAMRLSLCCIWLWLNNFDGHKMEQSHTNTRPNKLGTQGGPPSSNYKSQHPIAKLPIMQSLCEIQILSQTLQHASRHNSMTASDHNSSPRIPPTNPLHIPGLNFSSLCFCRCPGRHRRPRRAEQWCSPQWRWGSVRTE